MSIIKVENLNKFYKIGAEKFQALKDVNLSFEKGELVAIIGESGSGKSTLMNLIGGLDSDFEGVIEVNNKSLGEISNKELDRYRKDKIGFIFQSFNLIQHYTILDNITVALTLSNVSKKERIAKATKILKEVGLEDQLYKKPNQLSGGQKQRVAIARALVNDPEIILADEPTGSLDSETSKSILSILDDIAKKGKLIIMVTHSNKVASFANRIVKISDGRIINDEITGSKIEHVETNIVSETGQNLSMINAIKLALSNMREKFSRNLLVSLGASIGIMSVIIMFALGKGVENYIVEKINGNIATNIVEISKPEKNEDDATNIGPPKPMDIVLSVPFTDEDIEILGTIDNVIEVEKGFGVMGMGNTFTYEGKEHDFNYLETTSKSMLLSGFSAGGFPEENEIVIDQYMADAMTTDYEALLGKEVSFKFLLDETMIKESFVISGVYVQNTDLTVAFIGYETLEKTVKEYDYNIEPNSVYLIAENDTFTEQIKKDAIGLGYQGSLFDQMLDMMLEILDVMTYILAAIAGISLFVSAIMILVVLYISVVERTKEIGILKAIGARKKDIQRIFVSESFLIGFFGGIFGIVGAVVFGIIINTLTDKLFSVRMMTVTIEFALLGLFVSIVISVIAGLSPAAKAAKLDPIESLRHE